MDTNRNKNLSELLKKFCSADETQKCADDIRHGDEIFARHPAPAPRPALLADIRSQMLLAHSRTRKARQMHRVLASVAMAAAIVVVGGLAWIFMDTERPAPEPLTLRNFPVIAQATREIGTFVSELDLIEDSVQAIQTVDFDSSPVGYQSTVASFEAMLWEG
ncbi:MAG TPA: hypothetical protein VLH60_06205 [Sedimentisphaerales bacterium]|nr:hypothetical protein [Sedimentisphaerales bacterium]